MIALFKFSVAAFMAPWKKSYLNASERLGELEESLLLFQKCTFSLQSKSICAPETSKTSFPIASLLKHPIL